MRHFIRAVFILISMTSNNALSSEPKSEEPPVLVKIENYEFEYEQSGSGKALVETTGAESEGISYHSVTLSYALKGTDIVESPTLLDSLSKNAKEKCNEIASGSLEGEIISKIRTVSPRLISGKFICALK